MTRPRMRKSVLRPRLESLEIRSLLTLTADLGQWPLRDAAPAASLLVKFADAPGSPAAQADLVSISGRVEHTFEDGTSLVVLGQGVDRDAAVARIRSAADVAFAEPDSVLHVADTTPNDPGFPQQWGLKQANGIDIGATKAWDVTTGSSSTIVAIVDTGVDLTHPEFAGRFWTNPADGSHGYNFVANTNSPQDDNGHGTHVAGIVAATGNDGVGVAGVDWHAQIMALKFLDGNGSGSTSAAISAIQFAADHGARVINASWGGGGGDPALASMINYAGSKGAVFVAAAGNSGTNNDTSPFYPGSFHLPNMLTVAAVDSSGALASFSNYGPNSVDLAAPGVGILSTYPGGYATMSGTSMATPFVTGVVSLAAALYPNDTAQQLVSLVKANVAPLASLQGKTVTGGMVSAARVAATVATPTPPPPPPAPGPAVQVIDDLDPGFSTVGTWDTTYQGYRGNVHYAAANPAGADVATWTFAVAPGTYRVSTTWSAGGNRATNAPYTVYDGSAALGTTAVNQQAASAGLTDSGTNWQDLGTFNVTSSTLRVALSSNANQYVIADAIRIERVTAAAPAPAVQVSDGGTAVPAGGASSFGSTAVGAPVTKTYTVKNAGTAALALSDPIALPSGFALASDFGSTTLAPGASTTFAVTMTATAPGTYSGAVSFGSNDPGVPTYRINVSGTVTASSSYAPQIIGDTDPGFSISGLWSTWSGKAYHNSLHYASPESQDYNNATWTFNVAPGTYRVSGNWSGADNHATNAPFTVFDGANPLATVAVNQRVDPNGFSEAGTLWQDFGTFTVTGNTLKVRLDSYANFYIIASGMRVQRVS